jgi:hypothetical protein
MVNTIDFECDIHGKPHQGFEQAHRNLKKAYTSLLYKKGKTNIEYKALGLLKSGLYWTSDLLIENYDKSCKAIFDVAIKVLKEIEETN